MANQGTERKPELDVAKGLTMFLVVFSHVYLKRTNLSNWIFMFHMPAFFLFAGMTFKPEKYIGKQQGLVLFLKDKWKSRIVPYLTITMIGFLICMIRPYYRQPILDMGWRYMIKWIFYYAQPKELYIGQVWFLVGLFAAELFTYVWFLLTRNKNLGIKLLSLCIMAGLAMRMPYLNASLAFGQRLPWKLDTGLCAAVFLIVGYYLKKWNLFERCKGAEWFLCPFCLWLSYYLGPRIHGYTNICDCTYSPGPYYYMVAILGTAAIYFFAILCRRCHFWQYCGKHSLALLAMQTFLIWIVAEVINTYTGMELEPLRIPDKGISLAITVAVFMLMVLFLYIRDCCTNLLTKRLHK